MCILLHLLGFPTPLLTIIAASLLTHFKNKDASSALFFRIFKKGQRHLKKFSSASKNWLQNQGSSLGPSGLGRFIKIDKSGDISSPLFSRFFFLFGEMLGLIAKIDAFVGSQLCYICCSATLDPAFATRLASNSLGRHCRRTSMQFSMKSEPLSIWPTKKGTIAPWSACLRRLTKSSSVQFSWWWCWSICSFFAGSKQRGHDTFMII